MAKRINFWELPIEDAQPDDTVPAYRGRGQVARVRLPEGGGGDGSVTSVGVSMPSGFVVANSPVTSSGTITITFSDGYGLPTTAAMGEWSAAFGWGDHAQAGYALASAVTSALAGKVDTSDVRMSDAREWSASTVTQETAEAGTSTVRFAWTAQRVRQAIAAWWTTITINAADVQGLGTAAERNVPASGNAGAGEAVLGSDTRLTNSREWIAATVSQVDAEAGSSVARTAWTAQRVRQSVAAYTYDKATIDDKIAAGGGGGEETYPYRGVLTTEDLNDVRESGVYGQPSTPNATLARNYPANIAGALEVLVLNADTTPHPIVTQRYTTNEGTQRVFIRRGGAAGGWNAWAEIAIGVGSMAYRDLTVSTSTPSGTVPGQVWFQVDS